jgi:Conserved oligomeric complex COG6
VAQPGAAESQVAAVSVEEALSRVLKGVARPLQGRVTTVLEDCSDAVTTYKLMGYLAFYCETVSFE